MNDVLSSFRTLGEQAAYAAVLSDLAGSDRGGEAVMIFREPTYLDAAVVADRPCRCARVAAPGCRAGHAGQGTGDDRALPRHA
jgi:hypothetical protein